MRRVFLIASPGRGINSLECVALAVAHTGNVEFMRQGECLELCGESHTWGGESYVTQLNDDWDGFCAREGIRYAGLSATGARGTVGGSSGSVIPGGGLPIGPIQQFLTGLQQTSSLTAVWPLVGQALLDLPNQVAVALGPSDGTVRVESSRLDQAPFLASKFWGIVEAKHAGRVNGEQTSQASTYAAECLRTFCIEGRDPGTAKCDSLSVKAVDAPGHATWIQVDVALSGTNSENSPLALQLVESTLDASGNVTANVGYGAALRTGSQRFAFAVPSGRRRGAIARSSTVSTVRSVSSRRPSRSPPEPSTTRPSRRSRPPRAAPRRTSTSFRTVRPPSSRCASIVARGVTGRA